MNKNQNVIVVIIKSNTLFTTNVFGSRSMASTVTYIIHGGRVVGTFSCALVVALFPGVNNNNTAS